MKTAELKGDALDWAVAKCEIANQLNNTGLNYSDESIILGEHTDYSTDWAQSGPIIEREEIQLWRGGAWCAAYGCSINTPDFKEGETPLIAAMRCYVASKLGNDIEIPKELL